MKYYKIYPKFYNNNGRIVSSVNGEKILNAEFYFNKISQGEILLSTPIFDYFFLESYDEKKYWEVQLNDVHEFIGKGSKIPGWLISKDLKLLLENFKLSEPYHFYSSKLMYKGQKLDYYIFQYTGMIIVEEIRANILFQKSIFYNPNKNEKILVKSKDDFVKEKKRILKETNDYSKGIKIKRLVLSKALDFFPMQSFLVDNIVSERLKNAIEEMGITGFEFSELDYEVVINE